jgi:hypothetical protein
MAQLQIRSGDITVTLDSNDYGVAQMVDALSRAFGEAGGAWIGGDFTPSETSDVDGRSIVRWLPAATTGVLAIFDDEPLPETITNLPGYLRTT